MQEMGMPYQWAFSECYGFDEDLLQMIPQPCVAVVLNMERLKKSEDKQKGSLENYAAYYMKQTGELDNACGVIACIHSIYNNLGLIQLNSGSVLEKYLELG